MSLLTFRPQCLTLIDVEVNSSWHLTLTFPPPSHRPSSPATRDLAKKEMDHAFEVSWGQHTWYALMKSKSRFTSESVLNPTDSLSMLLQSWEAIQTLPSKSAPWEIYFERKFDIVAEGKNVTFLSIVAKRLAKNGFILCPKHLPPFIGALQIKEWWKSSSMADNFWDVLISYSCNALTQTALRLHLQIAHLGSFDILYWHLPNASPVSNSLQAWHCSTGAS